MDLKEAILESWDRQAQIIKNLVDYVQPDQLSFLVGPGEWTIAEHFGHIHQCRRYWLSQVAPGFESDLSKLSKSESEPWSPSGDMDQIRPALTASATQIWKSMEALLTEDAKPSGGYDHPLLFLQHMIWHEGWHAGAVMAGLRLNGCETPEEWEEANIWGLWRTE